MSNNHHNPNNVVVIVGAAVFCFVIAAVVAVYVAAPDGANTGSLITLLIGQVAPTLVALGVLAKVNATDAKVERVASDTHALTNGLLDSKVRAGVSEVIHPDLLHPDVADTIEADKVVRESTHESRNPEPGK